MALLIRNFLCRLIAQHLLLLAVQKNFLLLFSVSVGAVLMGTGKVFALLGGLGQMLKKSNIGLL